MADDAKRSSLVDITYQELNGFLSGSLEGTTPNHISDVLSHRVTSLGNLAQPFGKPSDASKKKIESGSVTLPDGIVLSVEAADKEFVFALSAKFDINQVDALVLLRSFMYNHGFAAQTSGTDLADELVDAVTPFYFSERLSLLRTLIPLYRANEEATDPAHGVAGSFLPRIVPDGAAFVTALLDEYTRKTRAPPPPPFAGDPRAAARWAKQNVREQLVMLEVLFWTMWSHVPCTGPLVAAVFDAGYASALGTAQENATMLLDDEGAQLRRDAGAVWTLLLLEVLELERLAQPGALELSERAADPPLYTSSPTALAKIHAVVMAHEDSQYAAVYLAWAFVLARLGALAAQMKVVPEGFKTFFATVVPQGDRRFAGGIEAVPLHMARTCLAPAAGLFPFLNALLTSSPLFVTSLAWRMGSGITDPNAVAFRSVFKGLIIALVEMVPVEMIPDFEGLVDVWVALFGRSEAQSIAGICRQFWEQDWRVGTARRALFDVARARFPVQIRPLVRLLRAMTGTGFLDTDALAGPAGAGGGGEGALAADRAVCNQHVFFYLHALPTYTQAVPALALAQGLYDRVQERDAAGGLAYVSLQPVRLPGGSVLPARAHARLLSADGADVVLVAWQHAHCGWKLLLELLNEYANTRRGSRTREIAFGRQVQFHGATLRLDEVGVDLAPPADEALVTDALDLIRSVVQDDPAAAQQLLEALEAGAPVVSHTATDSKPADLVQLTTMILEDALSRPAAGGGRFSSGHALITSCMSVLSALLMLPRYSNRVWLYVRSTTALFGAERALGGGSAILAAERAAGQYTMTLALLHLVAQLFREAAARVLPVAATTPRLQEIKEEVLLRAARFVHAEVWAEHAGWKYAQLGDRFEVGRRVAGLFNGILRTTAAGLGTPGAAFAELGQAVADAFLHRAAASTVLPIVETIASAGTILGTLTASRRFGDARRLVYLLQSHLALARTILNLKLQSAVTGPCLLEQAFCSRMQNGVSSAQAKVETIDVLAGYIRDRRVGQTVPLEAAWVLHALCTCLSSSQPSAPSIVGHLTDPRATIASFVRIVEHPYDDPALRRAIWAFFALAVDKEPGLAGIIVSGDYRIPDVGAPKALPPPSGDAPISAFELACEMLTEWKQLWELNPHLLSNLVDLVDAVWSHALEHRAAVDAKRADAQFWECVGGIVQEELGPVPDFAAQGITDADGVLRSELHEAVANHAYRARIKAQAVRVVALDTEMHLQSGKFDPNKKPASFKAVEAVFKDEDPLTELLTEASTVAFEPATHDDFTAQAKVEYPSLNLESLRKQRPFAQREFGDDFIFSLSVLDRRLQPYRMGNETQRASGDLLTRRLMSINLNLSLTHAELSLVKSWTCLLRHTLPYVRGDRAARLWVLNICHTLAMHLGMEERSGAMMASIHGERMSLLLALLEVAWFSEDDKPEEVKSFMILVKSLPSVIHNPAQDPAASFLGSGVGAPFHRTLLQILYFCTRHARSLLRRPKALNAEARLDVARMVDASLSFVVGALRVAFDRARTQLDLDLDLDLELLVLVFEQCTRPDLTPTSVSWLARCQEHDVVRASLELFAQADLVGLGDVALLQARGQPLYAPHVIAFHMALASLPAAAERLASDGLLAAYSRCGLASAISAGAIDATLPELPHAQSPAHAAYCGMLAVVASVVGALGAQSHFLAADVASLVQLFGDQVARALSWSIGDALPLPLLDELEQTAALFRALVDAAPHPRDGQSQGSDVRRVLRAFAARALRLLQQLNYALSHPNHLASLVEPVTREERAALERDAQASAGTSGSDAVDPTQRPFLAQLVHRLFGLASSMLWTLVGISGAESVLLGDREDWPLTEALVVPHSKVVLSEPASTGTLLELCNTSLDLLRRLSAQPAGQALVPAGPRGETPLAVADSAAACRSALEASAMYAATQLALWAAKPADGERDDPGDMDADESEADRSLNLSTTSAPDARRSMLAAVPYGSPERTRGGALQASAPAAADRLRRGMTGELATDLLRVLAAARPVLQKHDPRGDSVEITKVLTDFVQDHVVRAR